MGSPLALAPLLAVAAGALVALLVEAFLRKKDSEVPAALAVAALLAAGLFTIISWGEPGLSAFGGRLILDPLARFLIVIFIVLGVFVALMGLKYAARMGLALGPLCGLLLLAVAGLMIMVSTRDWLIVFLGLELLSVASYALTGLRLHDRASSEAAAKYFLMGSFAAAFFVFGLALIFGTSGRLELGSDAPGAAALAGLGLIVSALFFKIAVAPFHMWAPDVYEGAPTPVTVFLTIAPKAAGLAVLLRALAPLLRAEGAAAVLSPALSVAAVLTMFAGNLAALRQTRLKRLLAYSSIAHSGYLLVAVVARDAAGLVFYAAVYLFMNAGAFGTLIALSGRGLDRTSLDDIAGLGRRKPWLAAALTIFLLSLAGIPPTAGFLAKFYVFGAAVREGHIALTVAAVLASLVSVAYYLKVIVAMSMREGDTESEPWLEDPALYLVVFLCLFGVIELGLWPGNLLTIIRQAFPASF